MEWTTLLRSQQADFIQRLKSECLLHCETQGQHSELIVISGERLEQLRDFCWEMAEKYKRNSSVRKVFFDNMKGKLAEEVVQVRLIDLVTEVDYEKRISGDDKVDFRLNSDPAIGIQVKSRHGSIDTVQWSISKEEVEKNAVLVCILIPEGVSKAQPEYNLIMAGFLPTNMIAVSNGEASVGIEELLYSGGLRSYLESLKSEDIQNIKAAKVCLERASKRNTYQEKIDDYTQAICIAPEYAEAYLLRGLAHYELQNRREGMKDFDEAVELYFEQRDLTGLIKTVNFIKRYSNKSEKTRLC